MDRKKELKQQYKEEKTEAGIFQIKNTKNQKVFIKATPNLRTMNSQRFQLDLKGHPNKALQQEWNQYGEEAFVLEVLETLPEDTTDVRYALKKLEAKWLEQLQPYGERGYHQKK